MKSTFRRALGGSRRRIYGGSLREFGASRLLAEQGYPEREQFPLEGDDVFNFEEDDDDDIIGEDEMEDLRMQMPQQQEGESGQTEVIEIPAGGQHKRERFPAEFQPTISRGSVIPLLSDIHAKKAICPGCGSELQTTDPEKLGYIVPKAIETFYRDEERFSQLQKQLKNKSPELHLSNSEIRAFRRFKKKTSKMVCQRCFTIKHYREVPTIQVHDVKDRLNRIANRDCLVVYMVDLTDLEFSFIPKIREAIGNNDVLLVGNKLDLMPAQMTVTDIKSWLKKMATRYIEPKEMGGNHFDGVVLVSGLKALNFDLLGARIQAMRGERDVYIIGKTNVGKSTMTNELIQYFGGTVGESEEFESEITTGSTPGTTVNSLAITIQNQSIGGDKAHLFDTPGITNDTNPLVYADQAETKCLAPHKRWKPRHAYFHPGQTMFLGGYCQIDFISNKVYNPQSKPITLSVCMNHMVPIQVTKSSNAHDYYKKHIGQILFPPRQNDVSKLAKSKTITIKSSNPREAVADICISGLGWVSVTGVGEFKLRISLPKYMHFTTRSPIWKTIGSEYPKYMGEGDYNRFKMRSLRVVSEDKEKKIRAERRAERKKKREKKNQRRDRRMESEMKFIDGEWVIDEEDEGEIYGEEEPEDVVFESKSQSSPVEQIESNNADIESTESTSSAVASSNLWEEAIVRGGSQPSDEEDRI